MASPKLVDVTGMPNARNTRRKADEGAGGDEFAVREIQRLRGRKGDAEPQRDQRIRAADRETADECLKEGLSHSSSPIVLDDLPVFPDCVLRRQRLKSACLSEPMTASV